MVWNRPSRAGSGDAQIEQARSVLREEESLADLSAALVFAAAKVGEFLKPSFTAPTLEGRSGQWFLVQAEVLHFLLHMTRRVAGVRPGTGPRRPIDEQVTRVTLQAFVEVMFAELEPGEQEILLTTLTEENDRRDDRYAGCSHRIGRSERDVLDTGNVFSLATQLVLEAAGRERDPSLRLCDPPLFMRLHARILELYAEGDLERRTLAAIRAWRPR